MILPTTALFPDAWRLKVPFKRGSGRDKWGAPLPVAEFVVPDVIYQPGKGDEESGFLHVEGVEAVLLCPAGVDVRPDDRGVVPACPWIPRPVPFVVAGRPKVTPLGVSVPIREEG